MARTATKEKPEVKNDPAKDQLPASAKTGELTDDAFFDAGFTGFEDVTSEDVALPRFTILQGLSPQLNQRSDDYVEGAKIGDIINVATNEVFSELEVVFSAYQRRYVEWIPRSAPCPFQDLPQVTGGGLVQDHGTDDAILQECRRFEGNGSLWTPRGAKLVPTGTWYIVRPDTGTTGFIAMGNTHFTASKKIMAAVRDEKVKRGDGKMANAPLYYRSWMLGSRLREFEGNEWMTWKATRGQQLLNLDNANMVFETVKAIHRDLQAGTVKVDMSAGEDDADIIDNGTQQPM